MFAGIQPPDYSRIRVPVLAFFAVPAALEDQMKRYNPQTAEDGARVGLRYAMSLGWVASNAAALKRGVPGARIVNLPKANTCIFLSNEADVLREVRAFVAELPR
jgi:hypothetical protein